MALSVFVCGCVRLRLLSGRLLGEVGGWRVVLVGAGGGVGLYVVGSSMAFFFGFWFGFSECGLSYFEICLIRLLVVGVLSRRRAVLEGGGGLGCATHGCGLLWLLSSYTIWVMRGSSSLVRVYRSWMRDSCSAWCWEWHSVGGPPW